MVKAATSCPVKKVTTPTKIFPSSAPFKPSSPQHSSQSSNPFDPKNYHYVINDEKNGIDMNVDSIFLSKTYSLIFANYVISKESKTSKLFGMSRDRIAAEIYTHAVIYYASELPDRLLSLIGWDNNPFYQMRDAVDSKGSLFMDLNVGNDDPAEWIYYIFWYNPFL